MTTSTATRPGSRSIAPADRPGAPAMSDPGPGPDRPFEPAPVIPDPNPNPEPAPIIPDPDPNPNPAPVIPEPNPNGSPAPVIAEPGPVVAGDRLADR